MRRFLAVFVACAGLSACVQQPPKTVSLRIDGNVRDASVTVDDKYLGAFAFVAAHGVALPPGTHRITVEKSGYFPWDKLVEAKDGGTPIRLDVVLVKIPD
jgi:hypothetical protein